MDLTIAFECPKCKKGFPQNLVELSPGKKHECPACGSPAFLTPESLKDFQAALEDFCRV